MKTLVVTLLVVALAQASAPKPEELSELEALKLKTIRLQAQLYRAQAEAADCQARLGPAEAQLNSADVQKQAEALKADIEKAHPGFTLDLATGGLVKKPVAK